MPATFGGVTMQVEFADEPQMLLAMPQAPEPRVAKFEVPDGVTIIQTSGKGLRTFVFKCQVAASGALDALLALVQTAGTLVIVRHSGGTTSYADAFLYTVRGVPTEYEMQATETVEVEPEFWLRP